MFTLGFTKVAAIALYKMKSGAMRAHVDRVNEDGSIEGAPGDGEHLATYRALMRKDGKFHTDSKGMTLLGHYLPKHNFKKDRTPHKIITHIGGADAGVKINGKDIYFPEDM
jgi:hypothetical protein